MGTSFNPELDKQANSASLLQRAQNILLEKIVIIPDFPNPGIRYLDFYRTFDQNADVRKAVVTCFADRYSDMNIDAIVGIANGGTSLASALAYSLDVAIHPIRKSSETVSGALEASDGKKIVYRTNNGMMLLNRKLTIASDIIKPHSKVVLVDDAIASGGTLKCALKLLSELDVTVIEIATVFEVTSENGRRKVSPTPVFSLLSREVF